MILQNWEIFSIPEYIGNQGEGNRARNNTETWDLPPKNMYKLNFHGASKGNLGPTGFGGVIRNSKGNLVGFCWGHVGENSINISKLKGLLAGLAMAAQQGWLPIILEGDYQIILQMATKLLHGKPVSKMVDNWKMIHSLEQLRVLLRVHSEVQIHHVRGKANRLADLMANYGASKKQELQQKRWEDPIEGALRRECQKFME